MKLSDIGIDKVFHAVACGVIAVVVGMVVVALAGEDFVMGGSFIGFFTAMAAGIAKEAYDAMGHGVADVWDIVADLAGAAVGAGLIFLS